MVMTAGLLAGCGRATGNPMEKEKPAVEQGTETGGRLENAAEQDSRAENNAVTDIQTENNARTDSQAEDTADIVRIGSLKGPTSIGLMHLMERAKAQETADHYEFTMAATADELLPQLIAGDLDIALIPANVASVLYGKTEGDVSVIDINTLGVLYMVSGDDTIQDMEDLQGRTICLTGKGTTPDYVLQYLLQENGLTADDVTLEYKSEAVEVAAVLTASPETIGVLPQPFVTAACAQNDELSVVMDLTKQWDAVQDEKRSAPDGMKSRLVTGVTVVRDGFLEEHKAAVDRFLGEHAASAAYANEHVEETAELVAAAGIIEKAAVAAKAVPACNITYMDGEEMKTALSGYLAVLYEQDAASVGGGLPGDDFYYIR